MSGFRWRDARRGRGLESWDQYVSPSRRVVSALPEYAPVTFAARPGVNGKQPTHHAYRYPQELSAAELRLAEEVWAALPSFDALVKGER